MARIAGSDITASPSQLVARTKTLASDGANSTMSSSPWYMFSHVDSCLEGPDAVRRFRSDCGLSAEAGAHAAHGVE
jgi:hypothetical protein